MVFFQVLKDSHAASTALSTSSYVALTKVERVVPSTGDLDVHFDSRLVDGINSPFMKRSYCGRSPSDDIVSYGCDIFI